MPTLSHSMNDMKVELNNKDPFYFSLWGVAYGYLASTKED